MSPILKDVQADLILPEMKASNGRQVLQMLAREVSLRTGLNADIIYRDLLEQEASSASGIGGGVAIPHLQVQELDAPLMILARLDEPLDYHAVDGLAVDIVFLLLSPAHEGPLHLRRLSRVSRLMKNDTLLARLRTARTAAAMHDAMREPEDWLIAA